MVSGSGTGVDGYTDSATFAGQAFTQSRGQFACRLVGLQAVKGTSIANGAKVGLMARGDLSNAAASVGLEVSAGRGVHFHVRPESGMPLVDQRPTSVNAETGLIGSAVILADDSKPAANYLLRPVWLKLVLAVDRWTAFTSLDGAHWSQAGQPVVAKFVGAWVGLFATSHQSGAYVRATFDHVTGFLPSVVVQLASSPQWGSCTHGSCG